MDSTDRGYSVEGFAARAKSPFWNSSETTKLDLIRAWLDFARFSENETVAWVNRLERLDEPLISACFDRVPDDIMSNTTREFCTELICANLQRIQTSWNRRT